MATMNYPSYSSWYTDELSENESMLRAQRAIQQEWINSIYTENPVLNMLRNLNPTNLLRQPVQQVDGVKEMFSWLG